MDALYFQLQDDLDTWIGSALAFHDPDRSLKEVWESTRVIVPMNTYIPWGADALIRQLQTNSPFKAYDGVQQIDISYFDDGGQFRLVRDLYEYLDGIGALPLRSLEFFLEEIHGWLGQPSHFGNGMPLKDLWDLSHNSAFNTYGAPALVTQLQTSHVYGGCPRVDELDDGHFVAGQIKQIKHLRGYLKPCIP